MYTDTDLNRYTKKYLTAEEIENYFTGYWVIILNFNDTECGEMIGGEVWYYSKSRKYLRKICAEELIGISYAHIYIGEIDGDEGTYLL
jgi:hypothetical protein